MADVGVDPRWEALAAWPDAELGAVMSDGTVNDVRGAGDAVVVARSSRLTVTIGTCPYFATAEAVGGSAELLRRSGPPRCGPSASKASSSPCTLRYRRPT